MNCKELGYKVGDEFVIVYESAGFGDHKFKKGEVVTLINDDDSERPRFEGENRNRYYVYLKDVKPLKKTMDIKEA